MPCTWAKHLIISLPYLNFHNLIRKLLRNFPHFIDEQKSNLALKTQSCLYLKVKLTLSLHRYSSAEVKDNVWSPFSYSICLLFTLWESLSWNIMSSIKIVKVWLILGKALCHLSSDAMKEDPQPRSSKKAWFKQRWDRGGEGSSWILQRSEKQALLCSCPMSEKEIHKPTLPRVHEGLGFQV